MVETAVDNAKYRRLRANGVPHAQAVAMAAVAPTVDFSPPSSLATDLELSNALAVKAPLVSPAFTGTPTKNGSPVQSQADVAGAFVAIADLPDAVATALTTSGVTAASVAHVIGVLYTGTAPNRPTVGGSFVLWNGTTDPGSKAVDGDLGIGWL